ncbi:MAG TPA: FHA domain-containing protein [Mycobacteriales bacterium]|nr:FHA domain-containing protein [Mycobacteriales bacterium]
MSAPIVVQAVRFGFLVLLWLFVFAALRVIRSDVFGAPRAKAAPTPPRATRPAAPSSGAPKRKNRRTPHQLVVTAGALTGTTIALSDRPISIGRASDSTLVLTDDYASSRHARLTQRDGDWYVEDLGSTNGTYLDRTKVTHPVPIPLGTPIRIGKTALELRS